MIRWTTRAALIVLCLLLAVPAAGQGGTSLPSAEAWYLFLPGDDAPGEPPPEDPVPANPLCDAGLPLPGCPGDATGDQTPDRPNPYPADTLHVSVNAGADDTLTFLELDDPLRPPGRVTGGTLTLPVAGEAGTVAADTADLQACAILGTVTDGVEAGDPATAPTVDCSAASPAVHTPPPEPAEGEQPDPADAGTFTIDLAPIATAWTAGRPALALVPTDAAREEGATWHVAFSGREREGEAVRPITFTLEVAPEEEPTTPSTSPGTPPVSTGGGAGSGAAGGTTRPPPPPAAPVTSGNAPVSAGPSAGDPLGEAISAADEPAAPQVADDVPLADAATTFVPSVGLVYPATYFVPLAAVALAGMAGRSLARPLRLPSPLPRDDR